MDISSLMDIYHLWVFITYGYLPHPFALWWRTAKINSVGSLAQKLEIRVETRPNQVIILWQLSYVLSLRNTIKFSQNARARINEQVLFI